MKNKTKKNKVEQSITKPSDRVKDNALTWSDMAEKT